MTGFERNLEIFFNDQSSARAVDNENAPLGLSKRRGVNNATGGIGERGVQGNQVGACKQRVEFELLDSEVGGTLGCEVWIVGNNLDFQALSPLGDDRADVATPNDSQALTGQLNTHET